MLKEQEEWLEHVIFSWLVDKGEVLDVIEERLAPSVVLKSESELFCVGAPRFARRYRFKDGTFVNVRRLKLLRQTVSDLIDHNMLPPDLHAQVAPSVKDFQLIDLLPSGNKKQGAGAQSAYLADSLLRPRPSIRKEYAFLETDLGSSYAEPNVRGVPYVQHMKLGGGLCAQAACFIAASILHDHVSTIHGIPQITHLMGQQLVQRDDILLFEGLRMPDLSCYFDQIDLSASLHLSPAKSSFQRCSNLTATRWCSLVLRSYLASGFPVILPLDVPRMTGIYERATEHFDHSETKEQFFDAVNIERENNNSHGPGRTLHATVAVGYSSDQRKGGTDFLLNDPRALPFMEASIDQIIAAHPDLNSNSRRDVVFSLPVVPKDVQIGLFACKSFIKLQASPIRYAGAIDAFLSLALPNARVANSSESSLRENELSETHQRLRHLMTTHECPGEWRLLSSDPEARFKTIDSLCSYLQLSAAVKNQILKSAKTHPQWTWLQIAKPKDDGNGVAVAFWDATWDNSQGLCTIPNILRRFDDSCLTLIKESSEGSSTVETPPVDVTTTSRVDNTQSITGPAQDPQFGKPIDKLQLSLISSFRATTSKDALDHWPSSIKCCEYYAIMQDDIRDKRNPDAVTELASRVNWTDGEIRAEAERILSSTNGDLSINAIATYIPGISLPAQGRLRSSEGVKSQRALAYVLRFAHQLALLQSSKGFPFMTVEAVAGSRLAGIVRGWIGPKKTKEDGLLDTGAGDPFPFGPSFGYVRSVTDTAQTVAKNLERAFHLATQKSDDHKGLIETVTVALEPETSPLCAITGIDSMRILLGYIDRICKEYVNSIGLNCDIGHWILNKIDPEEVMDSPDILNRIVHGHISDQHPACHFGDVRPLVRRKAIEFFPWLDIFATRLSATGRPRYSNVLSVECEAIRQDQVSACVNDAVKILDSYAGPSSFFRQDGGNHG